MVHEDCMQSHEGMFHQQSCMQLHSTCDTTVILAVTSCRKTGAFTKCLLTPESDAET